MNSSQAQQATIEDLDLEKRVAEYLISHPDFFAHNTDILAAIQVPHLVGEGAVSLIEHQIRVLRKQLESERNRLAHLISRAREYEELSARLHNLTLHLMSVSDSEHLCALLREAMLREFNAEMVTLKLFPLGTKADGQEDPLTTAFREFIDREHTLCGPLDETKARMLFGATEINRVRAAALVPINADGKSGVLAIGSEDPERFHPDMGTDFLDRLGEIVSHKLRNIPLDHCGRS
ncbi:DUF484 family protein [Thiorhodococcus mannitoliphagus]|uniref:DUF484 family protein n=1 Tax=Thiorhodococcus mannitoliphagus TaxID=329406 RepID=A0A6P1DND6_9GAMM|nr:DUF484 family protein [Thiorhodococcus mannitoliphagus]